MKFYKYLCAAALMIAFFTASNAEAKDVRSKIYIYGFAASFNDSTVYFTDIQEVDSAWVTGKANFLVGRDNYSYQLRDYLQNKMSKSHPTCMVVYALKRSDCEKKYIKMKRRYSGYSKGKKKNTVYYEVKYIESTDFKFLPIESQTVNEKPMTKEEKKAAKKAAREKAAKERKMMNGMPGKGMGPGGGGPGGSGMNNGGMPPSGGGPM